MSPALLLAALTVAQPPLADRVWLEGEAPTRSTFALRTDGRGQTAYLSGGRWLTADLPPEEVTKRVPAEGVGVEYDFHAPAAGRYDVWARVGFESARSPFRWRLDGGEWSAVSPDAPATDLMAVADGAEVAWLKLGAADLRAGAHTLEIRVPPPLRTVGLRTEPARLLFGLDCVCLSRGPFVPNGPYPPGANWKTALDRLADRTTFEFPAAPATDPRRVLDLVGAWHVARFDEAEVADRTGPVSQLPDPAASLWKGIRVPGDTATERPDLAYAHRLLFRARVRVPAALAGRTFTLRFPNNSLLTTVFVNGRRCGFSDVPFALFECDATAAIRPGAVNEVVVAIKDAHYAIDKTGDGRSTRQLFAVPTDRLLAPGGPARFADIPVLGASPRGGILEAPSLIATGPAVIAGVAVRPSVGGKRLAVAVTVRNPTAADVQAEVRCAARSVASDGTPFGGDPAKTLPPRTVTVPAGQSVAVDLDDAWERPRLWWPDDPHRHVLETAVAVNGQPADAVATPFGFREWGWSGGRFTLNGVPWGLRADARHAGRQPGRYAEQAIRDWKARGQTFATFAGERPWTGYSQDEALGFFDRVGMPVRRTGALALSSGYAVGPDGRPNPALVERWRKYLAAWVTAERNHPSAFAWSIGTGTPDGQPGWLEHELRTAADTIRALDPTRPVVIDRGLRADLPAPAVDGPPAVHDVALRPPVGPAAVAGAHPLAMFADTPRRLAAAVRWAGVGAAQFDGVIDDTRPWQPVAVLCREADDPLPAGATTRRTLKAFNDTRQPTTVTVYWLLQTRGPGPVTQVRGKKVLTLPPGGAEEFAADLNVPAAPGDADLILSCQVGGRPVFFDTRRVRIVLK